MANLLSKHQIRALGELSEKLSNSNLQYLVIGGLAALAWGVERTLVDIDIQVSKKDFDKVKGLFSRNIEVDDRRYLTDRWDIRQMIIKLHDTDIDVCQAEDFYVLKDDCRCLVPNQVKRAVPKQIYGINAPVMPLNQLIAYKQIIARPIDLQDIAALQARYS